MGLGFNVCIVPTLAFCLLWRSVPVFRRERRTGVQRGREGTRDKDVLDMICMIRFQTEELEYRIWGFIWRGKNKWSTDHGSGIGDGN